MFLRRAGMRWCSTSVWSKERECYLKKMEKEGKEAVVLAMNRPSRKNAFGRVMLKEFRECLDECTKDSNIRSLILLSEVGGVFSAGADLKERKEMSQNEASKFVTMLRTTFSELEDLRCPTIAVIHGVALGGGLELALACDMRVCTDSSKVGVPETGLAIIPGAGGTQRLPRVVGIPRAMEMICTADPGMDLPLKEAMEVEKACYANILTTQDRVRGLTAFAKRETPVYEGN